MGVLVLVSVPVGVFELVVVSEVVFSLMPVGVFELVLVSEVVFSLMLTCLRQRLGALVERDMQLEDPLHKLDLWHFVRRCACFSRIAASDSDPSSGCTSEKRPLTVLPCVRDRLGARTVPAQAPPLRHGPATTQELLCFFSGALDRPIAAQSDPSNNRTCENSPLVVLPCVRERHAVRTVPAQAPPTFHASPVSE